MRACKTACRPRLAARGRMLTGVSQSSGAAAAACAALTGSAVARNHNLEASTSGIYHCLRRRSVDALYEWLHRCES